MRIKEIEKRQQEIQENFSHVTELVTNLTKGNGITDDFSLQGGPTLKKDGLDLSIMPNPDDHCEQKKVRKDPSGRSKHINVQ